MPKYIFVLFYLVLVDYIGGMLIGKSKNRAKKFYFVVFITLTSLPLLFFKYLNFFNVNLSKLADFLHWNYSVGLLSLVAPIGLSFITLQALSYIIEVYKGRQKSENNFLVFSLYIMFFPQILSGPIGRPQKLLPQFHKEYCFDFQRAVSGLRLMLWGYFKKLVIADALALYVNSIFHSPRLSLSYDLMTATFLFGIQIYCDFSGYTDIARGSARVLGFNLMENFNRPYFSQSILEFWRRWHISLTSWMRDYVYIPLGGNRVSNFRHFFNVLLVFAFSGLWHGANWTFIVWGLLHAFYIIFSFITKNFRQFLIKTIKLDKAPFLYKALKIITTFVLVDIAWIFFKAESISDAVYIITHFIDDTTLGVTLYYIIRIFVSIIPLMYLYYIIKLNARSSNLTHSRFKLITVFAIISGVILLVQGFVELMTSWINIVILIISFGFMYYANVFSRYSTAIRMLLFSILATSILLLNDVLNEIFRKPVVIFSVAVMEYLYFIQETKKSANFISARPLYFKLAIYLSLLLFVLLFGTFEVNQFIYSQF